MERSLGQAFVSEVDNAIRRSEANSDQPQIVYQDIRHAFPRRFPTLCFSGLTPEP
jgi:hypothetical protein